MLPTKEERKTFLEERQTGLGGSDIAAIVGADPFRNALDIYHDKTRPIEEEDLELTGRNRHLIRGILLEAPIALIYAELTGRSVVEEPMHRADGAEWAMVHVDRIWEDEEVEEYGVLEIKAPSEYVFNSMLRDGVFTSYVAQLQWGMFVTGETKGAFAVGNFESPQGPVIHHDMDALPGLIGQLAERGEKFWKENVLEGVPPEPAEENPLEVPNVTSEVVISSEPDAKFMVERLLHYKELRDGGKELYEGWRPGMEAYLDNIDARKLRVPGVGRVYWTWREGKVSFDRETLEAHRPLDYDKVLGLLREHIGDFLESYDEATLMSELGLDLSRFVKKGSAFRHFSCYPDKEEE